MIIFVPGLQDFQPLRLHGGHLPGGEDQLLREACRGIPEDGGHGQEGGQQVYSGCRFLDIFFYFLRIFQWSLYPSFHFWMIHVVPFVSFWSSYRPKKALAESVLDCYLRCFKLISRIVNLESVHIYNFVFYTYNYLWNYIFKVHDCILIVIL